jgi:hypothetical protein
MRDSLQALHAAGRGTVQVGLKTGHGVKNALSSRIGLERPATGGNSPVSERQRTSERHPSTARHANRAGIREVHLLRLNTSQ